MENEIADNTLVGRNGHIISFAYSTLREAAERNFVLRLAGSVAIWHHCPQTRGRLMNGSRRISDIDYVALLRDKESIEKMFLQLGFRSDAQIATVPGIPRSRFVSIDAKWHCDVFYDFLEFCHTLDFRERVDVDAVTLPLVELLLQKLQIVELNLKDIHDSQSLLIEHEVGYGDDETINIDLLCRLCSKDWGLWRTITTNLKEIADYTVKDTRLQTRERRLIDDRIEQIFDAVNQRKKSLGWKLRSLVGTRMRWYNQVEELSPI